MPAFWLVTKSHQDTKYSGECKFCSESIFLKMCSIVGENTPTTNRIKKFGGRLYPLQFVADNSNHNEADDANHHLHCSLSVSYLRFYTFMWRLDQTSNIHFIFVNRNRSICIFGPQNFQFPSSAWTCTSHLEYCSLYLLGKRERLKNERTNYVVFF